MMCEVVMLNVYSIFKWTIRFFGNKDIVSVNVVQILVLLE